MTPEQGLIDLETTYKRELAMGWAFIRKLALFVGEWGPGYIYQVADHLGRSPKTVREAPSLLFLLPLPSSFLRPSSLRLRKSSSFLQAGSSKEVVFLLATSLGSLGPSLGESLGRL